MRAHFTVCLTCAGLLLCTAIAQAQQPKSKSADEPPAAGDRPRRDDPPDARDAPRRGREPRADEPYNKTGKRPDDEAPPPGKAGPRPKGDFGPKAEFQPYPQPVPTPPPGIPGPAYERGGFYTRPGAPPVQGYGGFGGGARYGFGAGGMMPGGMP